VPPCLILYRIFIRIVNAAGTIIDNIAAIEIARGPGYNKKKTKLGDVMMKYTEMKYERVEYADFARAAQAPLAALEDGGAGAEKVLAAAKEFFALWQHYRTMHNLAYFRHTGNTADEYYSAESDYYNAQSPRFEAVRNRFDKAAPPLPAGRSWRRPSARSFSGISTSRCAPSMKK
jgi:hypothetical protein